MYWLVRTFTSSIGKKMVMAITGLMFCSFLLVHLIGNLTIYGGKDLFIAYVDHLHSYGPLITLAELVLLMLALTHICMGAILFYQNLRARPVRYAVKKSGGGRTFASATIPYTGLIILAFIILHLITFRFVDKTEVNDFQILTTTFAQPWYVVFYVFVVIVAAFHVRHGLWSAFQSLGANHPKYMLVIQGASLIFSLIVAAGFASIPIILSSS
ncbi:MAG: succinate dehydrogenase cytochrome b subunit [Desulfobacteraceae bacterium]|nr:succinate dehydrogenase cytochrome b subunit [Desulfobacteraceae bacterium]